MSRNIDANMWTIMDRIDGLRAFVAVAGAGSFTGAASQLRISNKLVSKYVAALESRIGATLLHRTTRALSLTATGERYLPVARRALAAFDALEGVLDEDKGELSGSLRISAPATFGEMFITELTHDFVLLNPRVSIDMELTDRFVSLSAEAFDIAIRIGNPSDSSMLSRKLGQTEAWVVASPAFLEQNGTPATPEELRDFRVIRDTNDSSLNRASFVVDGQAVSVPLQARISVNSAAAVCRLALAGEGLAIVPRFAVEAEVRAGRLHRLLQDYQTVRMDIQALYSRQPFPVPRVTAYLDFLRSRLRPLLSPEPRRDS